MKERRSCCLFCTARAERRAFVFSHHSDASDNRPRGFTAIMGNADGVNHIFARNGLVTVKADKFRDGVKGTAWANFKLRAVPCGEDSSVTVEDPPKSEEPQPPKECRRNCARSGRRWPRLERSRGSRSRTLTTC